VIAMAQLAQANKEWAKDVQDAWSEYTIYPITINPERSNGCTQVVFDKKPEFPEFLIAWQQLNEELEGKNG
jgi:hypothetical protein